MKCLILPIVAGLMVSSSYARTGIGEALKHPASVTELQLTGEKNEAALLTKNGAKFTALASVVLSGVDDSITAEQSLLAVAACPAVRNLTIESCGLAGLSGGIRMLVSVENVTVRKCAQLDATQAFTMIGGMPGAKTLSYSASLASLPRSLAQLRSFSRVTICNTDLALADGYRLNQSDPGSLYASDSLQLGFGENALVVSYGCYNAAAVNTHLRLLVDLMQGVAGDYDEMPLPEHRAAFNREHPLVHEPLPGLNVFKNVYTADAEKATRLDYPSGTQIFIPENAFVDANGAPVKGNVTIDYREFRDPVDILLSGIPMDYDSGGVKGHFESAGMFEINASVDGKEVFLAPGKTVDLKFAVVDTASTYNFYRLDETKGWVYESNPGTVEKETPGEAENTAAVACEQVSAAVVKFSQLMAGAETKYRGIDRNEFDARYENLDYLYTERRSRTGKLPARTMKAHSHFSLKKVYRKKGQTGFVIRRNDRQGTNPEMRAFSHTTWLTTDNLRTREMRMLFRRKSGINDMRVLQDGDGFLLEFKTVNGFHRVHAVPARLRGDTIAALPPRLQSAMFRYYTRQLAHRKNAMVRSIARDCRREVRWKNEAAADSISAWRAVTSKMNQDEAAMDYNSWVQYFRREKPKLFMQRFPGLADSSGGFWTAGQGSKVYQALSIAGFGIFNCDHCGSISDPVIVNAKIEADGKEVNASSIILVDNGVNSATTFYSFGKPQLSVTYSRSSSNYLLILDKDGRLYHTNETQFSEGENLLGNTRFQATLISETPATPEQLRDIIYGPPGQ